MDVRVKGQTHAIKARFEVEVEAVAVGAVYYLLLCFIMTF